MKTDGILTIAIDHIGVKWLGGSSVHRFDDGGTPEDESDDQWRTFSEGNGLPSDAIFDLEVDRWNNVWVATRGGAAVIQYDTLFSQGEVTPYRTDDRGNLLGIVANIAFDVDGGVWFQTENIGLARRGPDGRWTSYTELDGLVSEDIQSGQILALDIHLETGEVWIGTAHGLSRFQTSYFPKPDIKNIKVYPNPFIPSRGHSFITFNNVPTGATIHIYTLAGELIQELKETGLSLVEWDGLTDRREEAVSGLYLFTVKDPQGGKRVGKFVIIR
ncbi:T9SS type A sorting domain-containing protein [candidate division TA06 bacterium]|nr:T9SS type A sorting domain-containing protein [candidate division TA06 bacterium]